MIIPNSFLSRDNYIDFSNQNSIVEDNFAIESNSTFDLGNSLLSRYQYEANELSPNNNFNIKIKDIFVIEHCQKKRGRKQNKESKKERHTSSSDDNILRKIQTHFLNFIISFLNDCVLNIFKNQKFTFLNFEYGKKSKVSNKYFTALKNFTIKDLLYIWEFL